EGRLIIKNLTRDLVVRTVSFTPLSGQDSAPNLEPGPETSNQRSVPLPSGLWKISLVYGVGYTTAINDVMVTEGSAATVYFYKTTAGRGSLETQWLPPTDADLSGNANPGDVLSEDEGFLHVVNKSQVSIITGVEYNNGASWIEVGIPAPAGMSGNIAAGQASSPNLILPRGSWAIRFRLLGKDIPSVAVSRTIIAGQTVEVEYTDSLLTDRPPSGFGSLRIVNYLSSKNITHIVVRTQVNNYAPEEVDLSTPIPHGGGSQVRALRAGDTPGSRRDYIVQCYVSVDEYYEEVARVIDETISEVFITEDSSKTTEGGGGSAAGGVLTVYNRYSGQLPFKVFKIYLYKETAPGVWQDYVPPANAAYPKAPANNALYYNGASGYDGETYIMKGSFNGFTGLAEGAYKLVIVAGSYHWMYYTANPAHEISGITINEKRITYDCGNIFIAGGGTKVYNFDPYAEGVPDRDTPTGAVTVQIHHAGLVGTDGPITQIQVLAASETELPVMSNVGMAVDANALPAFYQGKDAYVFGVVQSNKTLLAPQASINLLSEGGDLHNVTSAKGGDIPDRFIVYQFIGTLSATETLEFCLPPGVYAVRVLDPKGTGLTQDIWFGRDIENYCDLHIANDASKTIALQWKNPSLTVRSTILARANFSTVSDRYLALNYFSRGTDLAAYVPSSLGGKPQYEVESHQWYYHPACTPDHASTDPGHGTGTLHYAVAWDLRGTNDSCLVGVYGYAMRLNLSDGQLYGNSTQGVLAQHSANGTDPGGTTALPGGFYTLVLTLKAKPGWTFRGFSPSTNPSAGLNGVNNMGTGFFITDLSASLSTNQPGINNDLSTKMNYRIRKWLYWPGYTPWIVTDGMVSSTGKLPGEDKIMVALYFRQVP
ncbi:MAG: hypothetical protein LBC88_07175, partial [Spirochaetaceae bacterium]|nr:hypothetical protein [Spirochaetaceae bacterium]